MFKPSIMLADIIESPRSRPMRLRTILIVVVGIILVPVVAEAALLCYSQWCEVLGASAEVRTPVIDSIGHSVEDARDTLAESFGPAWSAATHDPWFALPSAMIFIVAAMVMLRW